MSINGENVLPNTNATHCHAQLGIPDMQSKSMLYAYNSWDLKPLNLSCYQPSHEVCIETSNLMLLDKIQHKFCYFCQNKPF